MAGTSRLAELAAKVQGAVRPHTPTEPLVVALSGGADSAACAWALAQLHSEVRAVHVHHAYPASKTMAAAAAAVASALDIDLDVVAVVPEPGPSPEGAARRARYAALEDAAKPGEWIVTGHTRDDQAETVLSHLLRGAGTAGLAGIPRRRGRILRPLLDVGRSQTRELCGLLSLPYRDDPMNAEADPRRNVLRRRVLPALEAQFNPALRRVLARTAATLSRDDAALETAAARVQVQERSGEVRVPAALLLTLDEAVASRAARRALRRARGPHAGTSREVEAVLAAAGGLPVPEVATGLSVVREGPWVVLGAAEPSPAPPVSVSLPGVAGFAGFLIEFHADDAPPSPWPLSRTRAAFDADVVGSSAVVRAAQPSDRFDYGRGTKSVADVLSDCGVPVRLRPAWPVVEAKGRVAWVPGCRSAAWTWVTAATTRYFYGLMREAEPWK